MKPSLIITCEHGGREVPPVYAGLFAAHGDLLETHRGWDPGALELAREMAQALEAPLYASATTRLLVDLNRSIGHRRLHSEVTRSLTQAERQAVIAQHYRPHRNAVESEFARRIAAGESIVHVASHSFTHELNGVVRHADVGWLYDPRRPAEAALSRRWMAELNQRLPHLRLRRNYPYRGRGDGLASCMRKLHGGESYIGIELEINQRFVRGGGAPWQALRPALIESLAAALHRAD